MKLLTKELLKKIPSFEKNENIPFDEQIVMVKLFNPCGPQTWYIVAFDSKTNICFGFVNLGDYEMAELGDFSLTELENLRLPMGLKIERDLWFDPMKLSEVMEKVKSGKHI